MIPNALRINDSNRAVHTNAEAIRFGAKNYGVIPLPHAQLLEAVFQIFPRFDAIFLGATFGFRLVSAEKNMASIFFQAERFGHGFQTGNGVLRR